MERWVFDKFLSNVGPTRPVWSIMDYLHGLILNEIVSIGRQRGRVVRVLDLKSGDPEFKSRSDH